MNRKIVITGASSAIGQAIAARLAGPEDRLLLHAHRHGEALESFVRDCCPDASIIRADFADPRSLEYFCSQVKDAEVLVNAASVTVTDVLPGLRDEDIERMILVNISALIMISRAVVPGMTARRNGRIVTISSVAASRGNRGQSVYAGTKGFAESFTRSLAAEYGPRGVTVNCVAPGPIDAGSLKGLMGYAADEVKASLSSPRLGTPADVAAAVAFLCSEEASFINGRVIGVDGGFSRGV